MPSYWADPEPASHNDWRFRGQTAKACQPAAMALLRLPFALNPEAEDEYISHPKEADANLRFLRMGEESAPWTGYYSTTGPVKRAVANFGGVWFEIRRRENIFEAYKTA